MNKITGYIESSQTTYHYEFKFKVFSNNKRVNEHSITK